MASARTRASLFVAAIAAVAAAVYFLHVESRALAFVGWVRSRGIVGALVYALAYITGTVLFFPGVILTAGSGFLYGTLRGTLLVSPASVIGATVSFLLARYFLRDWVAQKLQAYPKFAAIDRAVAQHGFKLVLLLRLQPVIIPFALLNYALGLTRVRWRDYVVASWLGMLPATLVYVYLGSVVQDAAQLARGGLPGSGPWGRLLFWGGLVAVVVLFVSISRIARRELEREVGPASVEGGAH